MWVMGAGKTAYIPGTFPLPVKRSLVVNGLHGHLVPHRSIVDNG